MGLGPKTNTGLHIGDTPGGKFNSFHNVQQIKKYDRVFSLPENPSSHEAQNRLSQQTSSGTMTRNTKPKVRERALYFTLSNEREITIKQPDGSPGNRRSKRDADSLE
jgi:hypothetical protein